MVNSANAANAPCRTLLSDMSRQRVEEVDVEVDEEVDGVPSAVLKLTRRRERLTASFDDV